MDYDASSANLVPVTVLTGFLGSGKTTLLNHILSADHGKKIAVIENEFGEVGIDQSLVNQKFFGEENIFEMNNGCICCTVRGDLIDIIKKLFKRKVKFDAILIETTGLADPAPVAQTFFVDDNVREKCRLDAIITVVDAKHIIQHLDDEKPDGVENESVEQIAFADRIILNKIDLVTPEEKANVTERIKSINQFAAIIESQNSVVDVSKILGLSAFSLTRALDIDPGFLEDGEHQHDNSVSSVGFHFEGDMNMAAVEMYIQELLKTKGTDLFRYKGVLSIKGLDQKFLFQGVHMLFGGSMTEKWAEGEVHDNKFVFIGRNLNKKELTEGFMACKVGGPLRFKVGDKVKVIVDRGWSPGKVIKEWDEGNPYRVQLKDGTEVWAPLDEDVFIRKP